MVTTLRRIAHSSLGSDSAERGTYVSAPYDRIHLSRARVRVCMHACETLLTCAADLECDGDGEDERLLLGGVPVDGKAAPEEL